MLNDEILKRNNEISDFFKSKLSYRMLNIHGNKLRERKWNDNISEMLLEKLDKNNNSSIDEILLMDKIYEPLNSNTIFNECYNELFLQDNIGSSERETKIQQYIDWLSRKFSGSMTNYFNNLEVNSPDSIYWLAHTYDKIYCVFSKNSNLKIDNVLWSMEVKLSSNEVKNWTQFLLGLRTVTNIPEWFPINSDYNRLLIVEDKNNLIRSNNEMYITTNRIETLRFISLFMNIRSRLFLQERPYQDIPVMTFSLINTYHNFMYSKLEPMERIRIMFLGGIIKSLYGLGITKDIDYLISIDQNDTIYNFKFKPNTGIKDIFDDYGLTYYHDESIYFPETDDLDIYKIYQKEKYEINESAKNQGLFPKCSSGLRIGRYFQFFKQIINGLLSDSNIDSKSEISEIDEMDTIVFDPKYHINLFGINIIPLEFEIARDFVKTIDLGKISKKQFVFFFNIISMLPNHKSAKMIHTIVNNVDFKQQLKIKYNIYHIDSDKSYMKYVMIRKTSKKIINIIHDFVSNIDLGSNINIIIPDGNEIIEYGYKYKPQKFGTTELYGVNQKIYEHIYISSLPYLGHNICWNIVVTPEGSVNIGLKESLINLQCGPYSICNSYVLYATIIPSQEYKTYVAYIHVGDFNLLKTIFYIHKFYDHGINDIIELIDGNTVLFDFQYNDISKELENLKI